MDAGDDAMESADRARDRRPGDSVVSPIPVWFWMAVVRASLREIVRSVMRSFVPEITGLPTGDELDRLVRRRAFVAYIAALDDPDLKDMDSAQRHKTVAGRVGVALAFPQAAPHLEMIDFPRPKDGTTP
jgi:hypothetical protein